MYHNRSNADYEKWDDLEMVDVSCPRCGELLEMYFNARRHVHFCQKCGYYCEV
ncbi:MAG: hypothetical protein ABIE03_00310 [Patescibacteria group bacterium]|nr:hypothetical protein [Patescibacteria group bacterium]